MDEYVIRAKIIHGYLLPFEEEIMKLQDIMFFRRKKAAVVVLMEMNAFFLFLKLIKANAFVLIEVIYLAYSNRSHLFYWFDNHFFRVKLYGETLDAGKFRYSVAEISAFLTALIYMTNQISRYIRNIIFGRDYTRTFFTFFVLIAISYIVNLLGDLLILWISANLFFFFPLIFARIKPLILPAKKYL